MADGRVNRGKGGAKVIQGGGTEKSLAFPVEVVVVSDGGNPRLGDEFGEGQPKGDVHRDGEGVLDHQDVELEPGVEFPDRFLESLFELTHTLGNAGRSFLAREESLVDFLDCLMPEKRFRDKHRRLWRGVELACKEAAAASLGLEDFHPFFVSRLTPSAPAKRVETKPKEGFFRAQMSVSVIARIPQVVRKLRFFVG